LTLKTSVLASCTDFVSNVIEVVRWTALKTSILSNHHEVGRIALIASCIHVIPALFACLMTGQTCLSIIGVVKVYIAKTFV